MKTLSKIPSNQSSNYSLKMKKLVGKNREVSRNKHNSRNFPKTNQKNILHVTYVKRQITQRRIFGIVENHNVIIVTKFGHVEKNCCNKNKHQANFIKKHDNEQHLFYATRDSSDKTGGN